MSEENRGPSAPVPCDRVSRAQASCAAAAGGAGVRVAPARVSAALAPPAGAPRVDLRPCRRPGGTRAEMPGLPPPHPPPLLPLRRWRLQRRRWLRLSSVAVRAARVARLGGATQRPSERLERRLHDVVRVLTPKLRAARGEFAQLRSLAPQQARLSLKRGLGLKHVHDLHPQQRGAATVASARILEL